MNAIDQERESQRESMAADLLDHPGWHDVMADVSHEANVALAAILGRKYDSAEQQGLATERARGTLAVLRNIVTAVYRRANKPIPPKVESSLLGG